MSKPTNPNENYDLPEEYDLSQMTVMPKGRFSPERRASNLVVLDPDLAKAFPSDDAVNTALRKVLELAQLLNR